MGDIANMTDYGGYVNGFRLLRWLHSRAQLAEQLESEYRACGELARAAHHGGQVAVLTEMADDLERELTPPDYPDDDGDEAPSYMNGPHDPHKRSPGDDDEGVDLDDPGLGWRPGKE